MSEKYQNLSGVRIPPPILALLHLLAAFLLSWILPLPIPAPGWLTAVGAGLVAVGLGLAFWAFSLFHRAGTTLDPRGGSTALVSSGPYRYTRNPIYVGLACLLAGFPLIIHSYWGLILCPLLIVLLNRLVIVYEEIHLAEQLGKPYLEYKNRVHRWL